jgi:hypothetical protein
VEGFEWVRDPFGALPVFLRLKAQEEPVDLNAKHDL